MDLGFVDKLHGKQNWFLTLTLRGFAFCPFTFAFFHHPPPPNKKKAPKGAFSFVRSSKSLNREHNHPLSLFVLALVTHDAVGQREQRVVTAHADVLSRVNACAELADDNVACAHGLAAENFHSPPLSLAVAPVARAAAGLFVCHRFTPCLSFDRSNFERGLILSVTALTAVAFPALLFKDDDFFGAPLIDDLAGHFGIGHQRRAYFRIAIAADEKNISQRHLLTDFASQLFDLDDFALRDAVLLTAGSNYCIFHRIFSETKFLKENPAKVNQGGRLAEAIEPTEKHVEQTA
jgi:hypothetical protein